MSWPLDKLKEVVREAEGIYGRIDVLYNNAGTVLHILMAVIMCKLIVSS